MFHKYWVRDRINFAAKLSRPMEISQLGSWAVCPCFSPAHRFYCHILKVACERNFCNITFLKISPGFGEKSENLPTGRRCFTNTFGIKSKFLLIQSLALVKCKRIVLIKIKLMIQSSSTGQLPSGVVSLGSCILRPTRNILWENNAFRVSFNTRATKYCKPRNIYIWPFCCQYTLAVIVTATQNLILNFIWRPPKVSI